MKRGGEPCDKVIDFSGAPSIDNAIANGAKRWVSGAITKEMYKKSILPLKCEKKDKKSQERNYFGRKNECTRKNREKEKRKQGRMRNREREKGEGKRGGEAGCCTLSKAVVTQHASHCINTRASFPRFLTDIDGFSKAGQS